MPFRTSPLPGVFIDIRMVQLKFLITDTCQRIVRNSRDIIHSCGALIRVITLKKGIKITYIGKIDTITTIAPMICIWHTAYSCVRECVDQRVST